MLKNILFGVLLLLGIWVTQSSIPLGIIYNFCVLTYAPRVEATTAHAGVAELETHYAGQDKAIIKYKADLETLEACWGSLSL